VVFTANHVTDTDKQNTQTKYKKTTTLKQDAAKQNKTSLVQSPLDDTQPGNEVGLGLFYRPYNASKPTRGVWISRPFFMLCLLVWAQYLK